MDPVSVINSATTITSACFRVAKAMMHLYGNYQLSSLTIGAICTETTTLSVSLAQLQTLFTRDTEFFTTQFPAPNQLASAFDIALIGCMVLLSSLEDEIKKLGDLDGTQFGLSTCKAKVRLAWKEDTMASLLQQLRGQVVALTFLMQGLQTESLADISQLIHKLKEQLDIIAKDTAQLRVSYPSNHVPSSIFGDKSSIESIFRKAASTMDDKEFRFDDDVVNSIPYRRAMSEALAVINMAKDDPHGHENPATEGHGQFSSDDRQKQDLAKQETKRSKRESVVSIGLGELVEAEINYTPDRQLWAVLDKSVSASQEPTEQLLDWQKHFNLKEEDYKDYRRGRVAFQNSHWKILQLGCTLQSNLGLVDTLQNAQALIRWPTQVEQPPDPVQRVLQILTEIKSLHEQLLFNPLLAMWIKGGPWTSFDPKPFLLFLDKAARFYDEFSRSYRWAVIYLQMQQDSNENSASTPTKSKRRQSVPRSYWSTLLDAPLKELQDICMLLSSMKTQVVHQQEKSEIAGVIAAFQELISTCNAQVGESDKKIECKYVEKKFGIRFEAESAGVLFRQELPVRLPSGPTRSSLGPWRYCHVILLKDRLLVARTPTLRPEARHNFRKRNQEANSMEIIETLTFDSFESSLASSRLIEPTKVGMFAAGEVTRKTELWPISLVVERNPSNRMHKRHKHNIAWQIMLGAQSEQQRREWIAPLSLCDGVFNVRAC